MSKRTSGFGLLELLIIGILPSLSMGQSSIMEGKVVNQSTHLPVANATVMLEGTQVGTMTDTDGAFHLNQLPTGTYQLIVTHVGYTTWQQTINIPSEQPIHIALAESSEALANVVVTATRTERAIDEVPMPVQIITSEQIERIGSLRLNEVLQEQTGLQMISDHGAGLQMQGLSSDYILILIDGEPVIGRTAGTIDLTRLTVNNIARIEIIRGPASSLYGSEAMAGVVNIITQGNEPGWSGTLGTQYRSFGTLDAHAEASYRNERLSAQLFINRLSSDGFDLSKETVSQTSPPFQAYTLAPKMSYHFSDQLKLRISGRYYWEGQENTLDITEEGSIARLDEEGLRQDWNIFPTLEYQPNDHHKLQLRQYFTGYQTNTDITYQADGSVYDASYFDQTFRRSELQYDWFRNENHIITGGAGYLTEQVEATRYDDKNQFISTYAYAQYQWVPTPKWNVVAGGRYDAHSAYANRLSPKLAIGYKPNEQLSLQASFGGGYKAPDFRQLLLAFTNPVAGYSVFGSRVVAEKIAELQAQWQIAQILIDPETIKEIKAESSLAYNLGFTLKPTKTIVFKTNLFRNTIQDLIETAPIARKTNGQNVFSYFNYAQVITQGVETQFDYTLFQNLTFSAGYQYLDTRDKEAYKAIKDGKVFRKNEENRTVRVTTSDYGGLFNRSRHSGNAKLMYTHAPLGLDVALRGIYRGPWGIGDVNGNTVLDDEREYADGYWLINLATNKKLGEKLRLEAGINNLLSKTTANEPTLAGRIYFAGLQWNFNH
uniref:TonB-dependent receptor n=1 Tax=Roseihalotalea indica TaxID=2867963 RepID=A0AA49GIQ9_9BACT|nr:TonB-dependent receptor [Tunicatimonas sp. TK19036]